MSNVRIALGNSSRIFCSRQTSPSRMICIVLVVSAGKPRRVACSRAHCKATRRELNVPKTFLLIGPCNRPSSPRLRVYMAISVALRPFLLLSPTFRFFLLPQDLRRQRPRCLWHLQALGLLLRCPRRLASSSSVAVGIALPSHSMTSTSPP